MLIFAGLGNPGAKYAGHRHNIGFMAVDAIAEAQGFGPWRARFQGMVAEGRLGTEKVLLVKPQTFMNESGRAIGEAMRFYKLDAGDVVVFHDELDLAPGRLRVKTGGGHAGHNGLRSCHAHLGDGYRRVRLGIGHPGDKSRVSGYVLHDFASADRDWLEPLISAVGREAPRLSAGDDAGFMNALALAVPRPEKPGPTSQTATGPASDKLRGDGVQAAETAPTRAAESPFSRLSSLFKRD